MQRLKEAQAEDERLRSAMDCRSQHIGAEVERLKGKVNFLEKDNVSPHSSPSTRILLYWNVI